MNTLNPTSSSPELPKFSEPQVHHKGDKYGPCNRRGCTEQALLNHSGTRRYYCTTCARKINDAAGKLLCS